MGKSIICYISVWLHVHVWQARCDVKRDTVAIKSSDILFSSVNLEGFVIDVIVVYLHSCRLMDSLSFFNIGIFVHNDNKFFPVCTCNGTSSDGVTIYNLDQFRVYQQNVRW